MASERNNLITLKGDNYVTWKYQVRMLLMRDDLYDIVTGVDKAPAAADGDAAIVAFRKRKQKALSTIALSIDCSQMHLVGEATDPKELWDKLQTQFQRPTWANRLRIQKKLYNLKLGAAGTVQGHLKTFTQLFDELAVIGEPVKEESKVIILLASLPEQYDALVTALETLDAVPSWDSVTQKLLHHEEKLNESTSSKPVQALAGSFVKNTQQRKCYSCGRPGHIMKFCRNKKKNNQHQQVSVATSNTEDVTLIASAAAASISTDNRWLIDSGASRHMCNKSFSTSTNLKALPSSVYVEIGDGTRLQGKSTCDVDVLVAVNDKYKLCRIKDVLIVPNLSFNLLSVSQLTRNNKHSDVKILTDSDVKILTDE